MKRRSDLYLKDILASIEKVQAYTADMTFARFEEDDLVIDAVTRNLEIIGEIAGQLPDAFKEEHDAVPWRDIKNFRNVVIHKYHRVDVETVWNIVEEELETLKRQVESILEAS